MAKKKSFKDYTELGDISAALILKNFPFVLFLGFLATIYIANAHYSEKKIRQIQKLQTELKDMRWSYMSLKSEAMYKSKQSEVTKSVESLNLKISGKKPKKIVVPKNKLEYNR